MIRYILISLSVPLLTTGVLIPGVPATPALSGAVGVPANPVADATPIAPELSGLGRALVAGHDHRATRAAVLQSGPPAALRLQPSGGAAVVSRSGAARSDARDGVLGSGDGARSEPERAADGGERAARALRRDPGRRQRAPAALHALASARSSMPWRARFAADGVGDRPRSIVPMRRRWRARRRSPDDPDVQTLYADAVMNTMPWDYWQKDGSAEARRPRSC